MFLFCAEHTSAAEVCRQHLSHFGAKDERLVNGESPPQWHRYPSLISTNTLNLPSWSFAHRRPEPVSAYWGAGRASAGRDRRDGGVFCGGKPKTRVTFTELSMTEAAFGVFTTRSFVGDVSPASYAGCVRSVMLSPSRPKPFFRPDPLGTGRGVK